MVGDTDGVPLLDTDGEGVAEKVGEEDSGADRVAEPVGEIEVDTVGETLMVPVILPVTETEAVTLRVRVALPSRDCVTEAEGDLVRDRDEDKDTVGDTDPE
jgi:hypothetical protein